MINQTQLKLPDPERDHIQARSTRRLRYWSMEITNASLREVQPIVREFSADSGTIFVSHSAIFR